MEKILILAEQRAAVLLKGQEYEILDRFTGKELEHKEYEPLISYASPEKKAWYVVLADFVTMEDGTGIVHIAPAFGEDDYNIGRTYDLPVVQLVKLDGTFPEEVTLWRGQFVKDADPNIIQYLEERGLLAGTKKHTHEYPFCWRCDSPLLVLCDGILVYRNVKSPGITGEKQQSDRLVSVPSATRTFR